MNVWFSRLLLVALAIALLAVVFSIIPLGNTERSQPNGVIISPDAPAPDSQRHPPEAVVD